MSWSFLTTTLAYTAAMTAVVAAVFWVRSRRMRGLALLVALGGLVALWLVAERTLFWFVPITLAAAFALASLVLACRRWVVRGLALTVAFAALGAIQFVGDRLESRDWHNIGGYVDCRPACSGWDLLGVLLHFGPATIALVVTAVVLTSAIVERKRSHAPTGEAIS
jgi:hypothetical protein